MFNVYNKELQSMTENQSEIHKEPSDNLAIVESNCF